MDIYCMDTSSLIEMKEFPQDVFPNVWGSMDKLYKEGKLIIPVEVRKEIEQGDDELKRWVKDKKKIFIRPDKNQIKKTMEILEKYSFLAKAEKPGPNADPWLIALAIVKNGEEQEELFPNKYIVVTEESKTRIDRIPAVCGDYNIECINLIELFRREGWKF